MTTCEMLGCEDPTFVEGEYGKPIQSETMPDVEVTACDLCYEEWLNLKAYRTGSHEDWLLNSHEAISQVMEWVVAFEFGGVQFYVDEPVHYWVYPHVEKGTGVVTSEGVRSTGQTLIDVTDQGFGDTCPFEGLYDIQKLEDGE